MIKRKINIQQQIDAVNQAASQALASAQSAQAVAQGTATARPSLKPIYTLDFVNSSLWDNRVSFSRSGGDVATYIDRNGVLRVAKGNTPRYTHDPITKKRLGVIREESRTNLFTYSNTFNHSSWLKNRSNIITDSKLAPDESVCYKLVEDTTLNASHQIGRGDIVATPGQKYSASIALAFGGRRYITVQLSGASTYGGQNPYIIVDLQNGSIIDSRNVETFSIEPFAMGFYMVSLSQVVSINGNTGINVLLMDSPTNVIYNGDGNSGVYIFNGQIESGPFSTTPIITQDSVLNRGADIMSLSVLNFSKIFGRLNNFSVLYVAKKAKYRNSYTDYYRIAGDDTAGGNNYIKLTDHNTLGRVYPEIMKNGVHQYNYSSNNNAQFGSFFSHAIAVSQTDTCSYVDGTKGNDDNDVLIPDFNRLDLSGGTTTIISHFSVWNVRLSNTELQALTSTSLSGKSGNQLPSNSDLKGCAYVSPIEILSSLGTQCFTMDGKGPGVNVQRNVKFPFDCNFKILDSSGCTIIATPPDSCGANTESPLIFHAPEGKSLTYQITPIFDL